MTEAMERRAARRKAAAERARAIAATYAPPHCGCQHCNPLKHARADLFRMAKELNDSNGMDGTDLWIAWREHERERNE